MKIKVFFINIILFLFVFSFFYSFSQERPPSNNKPFDRIYDSLRVDEGYIFLMLDRTSSLIDRKGNVLFNIPGNLASFNNNKQVFAAHNDGNLVLYNKDLEELWRIPSEIEHELIVTKDNSIMFFTNQYDTINKTKTAFSTIMCVDSTRKKTVKWSSFEQRRYLIDFMMKDTSIFLYKNCGSTNPDSVLFKMAPSLKKIYIPFSATTNKSTDTLISPLLFVDSTFHESELFHMNSIQIIPENESEKKDAVFKKGNILLSFNNHNDSIRSFIAIVDPDNFKILWHYVQLDGRHIHTPAILPNGHILVYLNWSADVPYSCVNEIDPVSGKIEWSYTENFPNVERRKVMGSCQRLPNGNTLISNVLGFVYEVTYTKEIVWLWRTPPSIKKGERIVYRANWYSKENLKWLEIEK